MNAAKLLAHFDRISEAPDAVPRLRRFILDLAVRGELVEQDTKDEPAHVLAERIASGVRDRIAAGTFTEPRNVIELPIESLRFTVPSSWAWVRLIELAEISYGFAFESARFNSSKSGIRLIRIRDISSADTEAYYEGPFDDSYVVRTGDYLVGMDGDFNLRRWKGPTALLNQRVMRIAGWNAAVCPEFLALPLQMVLDHLHESTSQTTVKHLSAKQVNGIRLPIPPLAEQHRIVARVDELMALCDRLESAQAERETRRDRLVAASLNRLNEPAPGPAAGGSADGAPGSSTFAHDARFPLRHLPRLATRPEHIQQLRQTILTLAVRGRLVSQDPDDEPASELLRRIRQEKERRVREAVLRQGPEPRSTDRDDGPFAVPGSWSWSRIGTCSLVTEYGTSAKADRADDGVPVLKMGDIQDGKVILGGQRRVSASIDDLPQLLLKRGDLLYNRTNSAELVGKTGIYLGEDDAFTFASYLIRIRFLAELTNSTYMNLAMNAPFFRETQIAPQLKQQCGQANVNGTKLRDMLVPIPPLAEQHRIVAKVDELMALCDQLEGQLANARTASRRLLEAVLQQTLDPVA